MNEALDSLKGQPPRFVWHAFVKEQQTLAYNKDKSEAVMNASDKCFLSMDFAENYTCLHQDEIQSAHWRQRHVTLYTVMAYNREEKIPMVIASDCLDHDKNSVTAFTVAALNKVLSAWPCIKRISIWTDGPTSQFKNKFVFNLLKQLASTLDVQITWNFSATSHGKGPNDALGGNVKAIARRSVMTRKFVVRDAASFVSAVASSGCNIKIFSVSSDDFDALKTEVGVTEKFWTKCTAFPGIMNTHCVLIKNQEIRLKYYTLVSEYMD